MAIFSSFYFLGNSRQHNSFQITSSKCVQMSIIIEHFDITAGIANYRYKYNIIILFLKNVMFENYFDITELDEKVGHCTYQ